MNAENRKNKRTVNYMYYVVNGSFVVRFAHTFFCLFIVHFVEHNFVLNFIKTVSEKEIEDVEEITIKPYEQVFEIDIIPKVSKKMFSLGGTSLDAFMRFYDSADKKNILNLKMEGVE